MRLALDHLRGAAQRLGHSDKVRGVDIDPHGFDGAIEHVFFDLTIALVIPQQHDDRGLRFHCAGQFGEGKLQSAITYQAQHRATRFAIGPPPQPGPHCRGQGVAEGAVAGRGVKPAPWLLGVKRQVAGVHRLSRIADAHGIR